MYIVIYMYYCPSYVVIGLTTLLTAVWKIRFCV
jgi:hypothetical protein